MLHRLHIAGSQKSIPMNASAVEDASSWMQRPAGCVLVGLSGIFPHDFLVARVARGDCLLGNQIEIWNMDYMILGVTSRSPTWPALP